MKSLRNGTAAAIILSIVFVVVAVAGRDVLPSLAGNEGNTATSVANDQVGTGPAVDTGEDLQIGQSETLANGTSDSTRSNDWYEEDDDHGDSGDDDDYDVDEDDLDDEHDDDGEYEDDDDD